MFERFSTDQKITLMLATDEANELGHHLVGTEHILLGMLGNARTDIYQKLTALGLQLPDARAAVAQFHETHNDDDETHTESALEADRVALKNLGINLDNVRTEIQNNFGHDIFLDWGAGGRRGRRPHRAPHRHDSDRPDGDRFSGGRHGNRRPHPRRRGHGRPHFSAALSTALGEVYGASRAGSRAERHRSADHHTVTLDQIFSAMLETNDPALIFVLSTATTLDAVKAEFAIPIHQ